MSRTDINDRINQIESICDSKIAKPTVVGLTAADTNSRTCPMGLLPCLRRGSDRWWLPRSALATDALGQLLLAPTRGDHLDEATRGHVHQALLSDPPLLILAALGWPGDQVDSVELVQWLAEHITGRLANADSFLGAPHVTPAIQQRWNKLLVHYRTLPVERWMDDAHLWLESTGPPIPSAWRQQWPTVNVRANVPAADLSAGTDCMLQQLARMTQRLQSLERSFDARLHKSKLGALKQLAYGLSHEINNPLANISTRAQQLQRGEQDNGRSATLQRIIDQVYRAHEMIADLMFFANPPPAYQRECDLNPILDEVASSFHEEVQRQSIRLEVSKPDQPVIANCDQQMIAEAVRALIRNAIEAIGCQGTIVVSVAQETDRILVHIADSGPGLSEHARRHAFDPYFSGREAGRGLGLGLCRAYRIAHLHQGDITLAGGPAGCVATVCLKRQGNAE